MKKQRLTAVIAAMLTLTTAVSCGEAAAEPKPEEQPTAAVRQTDVTEEAQTKSPLEEDIASLPEKNYEGHVFTIMDRSIDHNENWVTTDVYAEKENGEPINDAVFQRNRILEEAFNIKIADMPVHDPYNVAKKLIGADDHSFDVLTDGMQQLAGIASAGYLCDWNTIPEIELSNPWWDPQITHDLSVKNKLFFSTGDISIMDNHGTWCVLFNKSLAAEYDFGDLYALVRDGNWTIDRMYDMVKAATKDLNGDGEHTDEDQWGYITERFNLYGLWAASGEKIITKDKDDLPVLTAYNDRSIEVMQKVKEMQMNTAVSLSEERVKDGSGTKYTFAAFANGLGLFLNGGMCNITRLRQYDLNFGILPPPKYEEAQERYYSTYSYCNCTAYAIPVTATSDDLERTGVVLEAMAKISQNTLTPAYYDITLKGKSIRDDESAEMLDIIFANRSYDLGNIYDWGKIFTMYMDLAKNQSSEFATFYAKKEKNALNAIEKFIDELDALE